MSDIVEAVYSAKRKVIEKRIEAFWAVRDGDSKKAAKLQSEIQGIKQKILHDYAIILD